MLTNYLNDHSVIERLRGGPAGEYLDDFAMWLGSSGYTRGVARGLIRGLERLAIWANENAIDLGKLTPDIVQRFHDHLANVGRRWHGCGSQTEDVTASRRFLCFLRESCGDAVVLPSSSTKPELVIQFREWLLAHRGVSEATLANYSRVIEDFVHVYGEAPECYGAVDVRRFVLDRAKRYGISKAKQIVTSMRMFLRFLATTDRCRAGLASSVPTIADWRLSSLPRYLVAADIDRLLAACDHRTITALRDKAIMLLASRLGLRASDVAALSFEHLDWQGARLRVSGKSRREVWLPIQQDVGDTIVSYLTHERPSVAGSRVFVKALAPFGPMSASLVSTVVRRAMDRAGIDAPSRGLHILRHSAATAMLRGGATLHEIGSVLRHASIETTLHYAKVDENLLRTVAAPWPLTGQLSTLGIDVAASGPRSSAPPVSEGGRC